MPPHERSHISPGATTLAFMLPIRQVAGVPIPPPSLSTALAGRYAIDRELGAGGMATVWLARDLKHHRPVAIKVLHPHLAAALGAERFLKEIRTTANLQHPNILPLFDSGEADGQLFYVMPFVAGETLRDRLTREHQLPIAGAARIASEVANALDYAHRNGVIHRDIKPENILLHDGHALVGDFGIALAPSTGEIRITGTGISIGTSAYMSPEQALGERQIDARCDIYALGAVLYEMLTGSPPFTGPSMQAILSKVLTEAPPSPTRLRRDLPRHLEQTVLTALQKDPAHRFDSAAAMLAAIEGHAAPRAPRSPARGAKRGLLVTAAMVVVAMVAVPLTRGSHAAPPRHVPDASATLLVAEATEFAKRRDAQGCSESIKRYSRAIEADTLYAAAWAGLAKARVLCVLFGHGDPSVEYAAARAPAEAALRIDSTQSDAYTARGMVRLFHEQEFTAAGRDFALAASFDSTNYEPWLFHAWVHLANNHLDSALASMRHAKRLAPTNAPVVRARLANVLRYAGDMTGAEREIEDGLRLDSTSHVLIQERFELNVDGRRCERARQDVATEARDPQPYARSLVAYFWAICGEPARAVRFADSVTAQSGGESFVDEFALAMVYGGLGDSSGVYRTLDRAVASHSFGLFWLRHHYAFRPYVAQPAFAEIMRRAHVQ